MHEEFFPYEKIDFRYHLNENPKKDLAMHKTEF